MNNSKIFRIFIITITCLALISCGSQKDSPVAKVKKDNSPFGKYVSNTMIATGNNYIIESSDGITYRAYFPVNEYGNFEYCFYFSNAVDSTYKYGEVAYVGMSGGEYEIENAFIADGGTAVGEDITNKTPVTFDGQTSKTVSPDEEFWSDSVSIDIPENHFLVWEWTLTGENIPCTYMSSLTSTTSAKKGEDNFNYCDQIPLPQLIGCNRDVKYRISAIGDSITQGCQTPFMEYVFWTAQLSEKLGDDYSFWNCGLGWSRTSDIATNGNWLNRAKTSDIVLVAFGTNDIISGEYGAEFGNTAQEIDAYLRTVLDELKKSGCTIIVFNAPPEDYKEDLEAIRLEYNENLKSTCKDYNAYYFDFASYLSSPEEPAKALYGGHPNGDGGTIVSDAFIEEFKILLDLSR